MATKQHLKLGKILKTKYSNNCTNRWNNDWRKRKMLRIWNE